MAGAGGAFLLHAAHQRLTQPGPLAEARAVTVPRGAPSQLAETLVAQGVIPDGWSFRIAALLTQGEGTLHAAELAFPAHASLRQVLTVLRTGRAVQHQVTIPEGLTAAQIALLLNRPDTLAGDAELPDEGAVLPQTYAFERGAARASVVERAHAAMQRALAQAWEDRAEDSPLASPQELLTLASIVERETARPEERPRVAAVFLNRLRRGMRLQSDATVTYGASGGMGVLDHGLTRAELDAPNPYNTYQVTGLPPGPIASPGIAALRAASRPTPSEELYFVADGNGGHVFARTLEEHNRNVARWRAASAAR